MATANRPMFVVHGVMRELRRVWAADQGGGVPRKVRQLIADVAKAGMEYQPRRGKGSHRVYKHEASGTEVTISGHTGADAQPYQERDVRDAIKKIRQFEQGEG